MGVNRLPPGRYNSPLRYPGGKGKVANYLKLVMLENDIVGSEYVEPYAGGASVALALLFEDYASHIHINDINPGVHAFWNAVLNDTDALCELIESTSITVEEWLHQREVYRNPKSGGTELGFATFFLNRTNRSGIIAGGGVIGGLDQTGKWKIDARYNTDDLVLRVRKVARFKSRVSLTALDAAEFLKTWTSADQPSALLYLDPPYFAKGADLYDNFYGPADHRAIAKCVRSLRHPWIVSYDNAPEIVEMYAGRASRTYSLNYSAAKYVRGSEVMFSSPKLKMPQEDVSRVPSERVVEAVRQTVTS